jgi:hypothetical protein
MIASAQVGSPCAEGTLLFYSQACPGARSRLILSRRPLDFRISGAGGSSASREDGRGSRVCPPGLAWARRIGGIAAKKEKSLLKRLTGAARGLGVARSLADGAGCTGYGEKRKPP